MSQLEEPPRQIRRVAAHAARVRVGWQVPRDDRVRVAHVDRAHGLQSVYQASLVPAAIAFITGDVSQAGQIAAILPGILLQAAYSREFEQQADDDAGMLMRRLDKTPDGLATLLERIEAKMCGKKGCGASWLGSHPDTAARAARMRGN